MSCREPGSHYKQRYHCDASSDNVACNVNPVLYTTFNNVLNTYPVIGGVQNTNPGGGGTIRCSAAQNSGTGQVCTTGVDTTGSNYTCNGTNVTGPGAGN